MTDTHSSMSSIPKEAIKTVKPGASERAAVRELVKAARARGEDLTGPEGLLKAITATVLEAALEEEMTEHLGHDKHRAPAGGAANVRNGTRPKTVLAEAAGQVTIEVPRDRAGTLSPVIVAKRQRRLTDVDKVAISLYAKGLTTGKISAHFAEVYGASISKDTISRITCTWSPAGWIPRTPGRHDGPRGGSQPSTLSPTACRTPRTSNKMRARNTVNRKDPSVGPASEKSLRSSRHSQGPRGDRGCSSVHAVGWCGSAKRYHRSRCDIFQDWA